MSHDATNWAIKQRGIKPAVKIVLWHLCDCHNPSFGGAFPSQEYLAEQCEIPRSTLNVYLDQLEEMGLIIREQRRKAGSRQMERTRYFFPFDPDFEDRKSQKPCPETGHGEAEAESRNQQKPSPENGESHVQNLDSNLVKEPVREPVISLTADAGESSSRDDRKKVEAAFWSLVKDWPNFATADKQRPLKLWLALTADERALATLRYPEWRKTFGGRTHIPMPSTYLAEKLWNTVSDPSPETLRPGIPNAWSKAWSALRLSELVKSPSSALMPPLSKFQQMEMQAGGAKADAVRMDRLRNYGWPKVNTMHQRAQNAQGVSVLPSIVAFSESFVSLHRDSEIVARWKALHERNGWPWMPVPKAIEWLFFPAGEPEEAIIEFERSISEGRSNDDAA
ncbi:helix-turn-helix domain-containing protein [Rhizobium sp. VS19-DR104.2]|uniref:helix-turn-helix domain-containing protein n=1 Tax=unclassified Rhizobium TaxID=2613769 RepID=UPI001CC37797|nr:MULTISPECIES: helix-turn-helix domain-containing protein [unclassified Rhizobium]MBZ5760264.1 helix-turn-helix domain-containing protein [Rhizobium sp. VS19-DR96]MBZ5766892.1 helix-turn-helix domain-containing protein [Rhizobium sp. VS19-DR129.2]MBZ5773115.1 helix-turn-helix domain-containing protein [Rhizobium sp. VS19-DRK62.2]MBZ5784099.1 helix-turn-helix domain-containing protein [Rhizobium sp. VS19-DR121]MBZ5802459.1 helix-turn-helix domain-containing protein [Rhizobium sp. VS19-DR181]